jgi:hypothetical protein
VDFLCRCNNLSSSRQKTPASRGMNAAYYQKYIEFIYPIKHNIIMKLRYKYRIYPSELQEHNLNQTAGNARFIWNHFLKLNKDKYEKEKKFIFYNEMANQLPNLKQPLMPSLASRMEALTTEVDPDAPIDGEVAL